ncbi:hypothetical protein GCM10011371_12420 [Novosphingobium marinum]|uniref:Cell wall hydrolase SleB domain-containing protein n=1 Tax=Novosphingobium marinum TaxID=1514948 RepID=A0A7Y9XVF7_9SPHN|nr:cell wall hydrolase [Novosphingobium marinum]NYH95351.1 hypothetical protein [Novosphingobium marinum]GGC26344.1 hypothetical protein GCM10011371_12420 [Novosphingobium marinum]
MTDAFTLPPEPRPRDFSARVRRSRMVSVRADRRRRATPRAAFALVGAVALPAFAAPGEWEAFQIGNAPEAQAMVQPMPFEQAGSSFPGSAFYYLAVEDAAPVPDLAPATGEAPAPAGPGPANFVGPAASALRIDHSGVDRTRALQCLTAAVYYEAASEPDTGQRAVAQVVLNRVAHPSYPATVCGVVYQGSERRTGCQFSFTCDGSLARKPSRMFWQRAESVARAALGGYVHAPAGLATHYHTVQVNPYWASSLTSMGTIGAHRFYRFGGAAGRPGAFRFAYAGGEPTAAPLRRAPVAAAALDPVAVQAAFDAKPATALAAPPAEREATAATAPAAAPQPVASEASRDRLPGASKVRPEYRNSGRWIARPGD